MRLGAADPVDLEEEVRQGRFREDLYFRLNVVNVHLPPLRERAQDIDVLAKHFARKYAEANGVETPLLSEEALQRMRSHFWRGNVRELENTMHRAILLAQDGVVTTESILLTGEKLGGADLAWDAGTPDAAAAAGQAAAPGTRPLVGRTVADVERDLIIDTLQHCLGNRTHAANILGISIRTLRNKLKIYSQEGCAVPAPRDGDRAIA